MAPRYSDILKSLWFPNYLPPDGISTFQVPGWRVLFLDVTSNQAKLARADDASVTNNCPLRYFGSKVLDENDYVKFLRSRRKVVNTELVNGIMQITLATNQP